MLGHPERTRAENEGIEVRTEDAVDTQMFDCC